MQPLPQYVAWKQFSETIDLGIQFSEKEHLSIFRTLHSRRLQGQLLSI